MTMLSNETVRKLHEMRLGVMAEAFSEIGRAHV